MEGSRLDARIAGVAFWSYAAHVAGRVIAFVGLAILARLLTPHDFGLFAMAMVAVSFFEVSRDFGLRRALIYFGRSDESEAVFDTGFGLTVAAGAILNGFMLLLAPLAGAFYGNAEVTTLMLVLSLYFLISGVGMVPDAILTQRLDFGQRFWPETGAPLARYAVAIILAVKGFGAWSLVGGQLVGITLGVVLSIVLSRWSPSFHFRAITARKLLRYASQISAVELLAALILNLDYLLIGRFLGSSELGIYTLAFKLPETAIVALANVSSTLLLPAYVQLKADQARLRAGFLQALHYLALILAPAGAGICVLAPVLVPLLFGDQWVAAVPVLQLLAVSSSVYGILFSTGPAFVAAGRPRLIFAAQTVWATILIPCLYVAAQWNIIVVAAVHVAGILVYAAVTLALISRLLAVDLRDLLDSVWPSLLATGLMVLALLALLPLLGGVSSAVLAVAGVVVGAGVYGAAVWVLDARAVRQLRALTGSLVARS